MDKKVLNGLIYYEELVSNISFSAMVFVGLAFIRHLSERSLVVDLSDVWIVSLGVFAILTVVDIVKR